MVSRWSDKQSFGADYSHGFLIPFVSLGILWSRREEIKLAPKQVCLWGLGVIVMALMFHWLGAKMQQTRISLISLILLLWGIPLYFFGWKLAKILIFPCAYLIFCVPLNFLDALSGPLQMVATSMAHGLLNGLGIECERVGTQLMSPFFRLNVEAPCSGLRSLLAMTALSAVYAYYTQQSFVAKWLLFLASIPIAVVGNIGRIISIALVSITAGQQFGTGLHHDWSGYVLFALAISLMIGFGKLLQINYKESFRTWRKVYLSRS
jgi:exosortase